MIFGVDVTQIPGLETMALPLFGEVGRDMSKWPTADHFASWQGLCPDNDISGGRVLWKGTRKLHNRAGQMWPADRPQGTAAPRRLKAVGIASALAAAHRCGFRSKAKRIPRPGGKTERTPISKQRNKHLQTMLIEAAKLAPRWNAELALVYERAKQKGNRNRATLAVARKLVAYLML